MLGEVEVDESFFGVKNRNKHAHKKLGQTKGPYGSDKVPVFGALERGGRVCASGVPDTKMMTLPPKVEARVLPRSTVYSDEVPMYDPLERMGYKHGRVYHAQKVYVAGRGDAHVNSLEEFWSLVKRRIGGVHHSVSRKYLQDYLNVYAFRSNHRHDEKPMFRSIVERVASSHPPTIGPVAELPPFTTASKSLLLNGRFGDPSRAKH